MKRTRKCREDEGRVERKCGGLSGQKEATENTALAPTHHPFPVAA